MKLSTNFRLMQKTTDRIKAGMRSLDSWLNVATQGKRQLEVDLSNETSKSEAVNDELRVTVAQMSERDTKNTNFENVKRELRSIVSEAEENKKRLEDQIDSLKDEKQKLENNLSTAKSAESGIWHEKQGVELLLNKIRSKLDEAKHNEAKAKNDLQDSNSKVEQLKDRLAQDMRKGSGLANKRESLSATRARIIVEELENKFKASTLKASDLEEAEKKLKNRVSETGANLEKTKTELGRRDREFTAEKKKVEEVKRDLDKALQRELEYDPDRLNKQLDESKVRVNGLNNELTESKNTSTTWKNAYDQMYQAKLVSDSDKDRYQTQYNSVDSRLSSLYTLISNARSSAWAQVLMVDTDWQSSNGVVGRLNGAWRKWTMLTIANGAMIDMTFDSSGKGTSTYRALP